MADFPKGVEIRNNKICIWFMYRGKRCREVLQGWAVTPGNLKKAGSLRAVIVSEIQLGEFNYHERFPQSQRARKVVTTSQIKTWGELAKNWLAHRELELTPNTIRKTASQLRTLCAVIGEDTPLNTITHNDILTYRTELLHGSTLYPLSVRSNKIGRSVRTVDNYISLLCTILRFGARSGFVSGKPYEGIRKLQKSRAKPDPLLKDEFQQLIAALEKNPQQKNLWQFAIFSGLRHGELAALAWEDVDLDAGTVSVKRNLTSIGLFGPPKTAAGIRTISLLGPALEALKAQRALTALQPKTEITFHHREYGLNEKQHLRFVFIPRMKNGEQKPYYSLSSIGSRWNAAVKRAGIRRRNPYHTRHTFACWLLSAGANPSFIASQMGHENAQMVYEVYATWIEDLNNSQVDELNKKLRL